MRFLPSVCVYTWLFILGLGTSIGFAAPLYHVVPRGEVGSGKTVSNPAIGADQEKPDSPKPTAHTSQQIEGWTVMVDNRLLTGPDKDLGDRALHLLANRLSSITLIVPADRLAKLQKVPIRLDKTNGKLVSPQYHPSVSG